MVFCITNEKNEVLSNLLEELALFFYKMDDIESMFINPYYVRKLMGLDLDGSIEKAGINIRVDIVQKNGVEIKTIYNYPELKEMLERIYNSTFINVIPVFTCESFWVEKRRIGEYTNKDYLISEGDILFDKNNTIIDKKNSLIFSELKMNNAVEFSPTLKLKRIEE